METGLISHSTQPYDRLQNAPSDADQRTIRAPTPSSPKDPSVNDPMQKPTLTARAIMILPLVSHAIISIFIATTVLLCLNRSQYFLERHPTVVLADGTPFRLGGYHILQSDVTTIISASLVILRWVAAGWAGPLCWRVICLLGEEHGVQRRDIRWASNHGFLPPTTHIRQPLALALGLILAFTAIPQATSPLLTGSIVWEPTYLHSKQVAEFSSHPVLNVTGQNPKPGLEDFAMINPATLSNLPIWATSHYIASWGTAIERNVFKRVVPSVSGLNNDATVATVILPYFSISSIEWFQEVSSDLSQQLLTTLKPNGIIDKDMTAHAKQSGFILLTADSNNTSTVSSWMLVLRANFGNACNKDYNIMQWWVPGECFAMARVSYVAKSGICTNCRVTSRSVVQNDTDLSLIEGDDAVRQALEAMPQLVPKLTPLATSLPPPEADPNQYVEIFLARLYSSIWNVITDSYVPWDGPITTEYTPSFPGLKARVNNVRVHVWLAMQLLATVAGLVFVFLQAGSQHPLVGDTDMMAFDLDSTDVPKPSPLCKSEPKDFLRIKPTGDGWKVATIG